MQNNKILEIVDKAKKIYQKIQESKINNDSIYNNDIEKSIANIIGAFETFKDNDNNYWEESLLNSYDYINNIYNNMFDKEKEIKLDIPTINSSKEVLNIFSKFSIISATNFKNKLKETISIIEITEDMIKENIPKECYKEDKLKSISKEINTIFKNIEKYKEQGYNKIILTNH
jgi:hypothetical protein